MTTISLHGTERPTSSTSWTSFVASFSEFCSGVREGREIEARYRKLSRMSRPDLSEIGLDRSDIYRAALLGRPV